MKRYKGSVLSGRVEYDDSLYEWYIMDEEINEPVCITDLLHALSEHNLIDFDSIYNGSILDLKEFYVNNHKLCGECKAEMAHIGMGELRCGQCGEVKIEPNIKDVF